MATSVISRKCRRPAAVLSSMTVRAPATAAAMLAGFAQVGDPGRREKAGLTDQGLGLPEVVAHLAQLGRPAAPAALARQRLAENVGGGRGLALVFRLLSGLRTGRLAPGPLSTILILAPGEILRLNGDPLAQPLREDAAALAVGQAGQLPVEDPSDHRAHRSAP
ncbi:MULTISPECIES: hypothetical protein, partial [unclassified Streptomyces]|uniref:hypothetical protein n=1 Tax=unclassified Streptomyces TaxID=2593676 RepID=UPI003645EC25